MPTYTPCTGTGQTAKDARVIKTTQPKYFRLNGKISASCAECGKTVRLASLSAPAPMHKDQRADALRYHGE